MKRNILIITLIALICISCGREERGKLTQKGKEIHDSWYNASRQMIENDVIPMFHLDVWINTDNEDLRRLIEDRYFPYYRIREDGDNVFTIYNGANKIFTINTYGKSLKTNGSNWLVTKYNTYVENRGDLPIFLNSYSEREKLHISKSNDQWLIQMDSTENQGCYCNLYIKSLANEGVLLFSENYYTLSGNGLYIYSQNGLISLKFDITETISRKWVSEFYFHEGAVEFEAQKSNHENIPIKAEYLDKEHFRLTYRNITEVWEFWETSYSY